MSLFPIVSPFRALPRFKDIAFAKDASDGGKDAFDFAAIDFDAGDILTAIIMSSDEGGFSLTAPSGFTTLTTDVDGDQRIAVYQKVADGTEGEIAISKPAGVRFVTSTVSVSSGSIGIAATLGDGTKVAPSINNGAGDILFAVAFDTAFTNDAPPVGYTDLGGIGYENESISVGYIEDAEAAKVPGQWVNWNQGSTTFSTSFSVKVRV